MNIIIFGKPGSGKGIISQTLINHGFIQLSTGDLLRKEINKKTELGNEIDKLLSQGKFASDEVIFTLVNNFIKENNDKNIIFDGFPRNLAQAEELIKQAVNIRYFFNLNVDDQTVLARASSRLVHPPSGRIYNLNNPQLMPKIAMTDDVTGEQLIQRNDDKPEVIKERLKTYQKVTAPVYHFLKDKVETIEIDATINLNDQIKLILSYCNNNKLKLSI